ncbi:MAG: hypothetical protein Q8N63_07795 [Nanoarchaeota archaeon]|nr:hypothetical protein [Nanoarchaeota archaeon]
MEISDKTHKEDFANSALESMIPIVLRLRIQTCIGNYDDMNSKSPNAIILSKKARAALHNAGLLDNFYSVSEGKRRVTLFEGDLKLEVYHIDELAEEKRSEVNNNFSSNPKIIYLGRTSFLGKLKEKSLKEYKFEYSF